MKQIYLAKCKTPGICKETFDAVIDQYKDKADLRNGMFVVRTDENIEEIEQKFHESEPCCNAMLFRTIADETTGKGPFNDILK
jgi:hypothetical protein